MNLPEVGIWDVADVLLVTFFLYRIFLLLRGTRAVQLLKGLGVLFLVYALSRPLHLRTVNWLLQKSMTALFVALPIVFLPELRRALEQLGRGRLFTRPFGSVGTQAASAVIGEVVRAVDSLSKNRTGALIAIEDEVGLDEIAESGVKLDSAISAELLSNIFVKGAPLHDGAVIIRGDRVLAAGCVLPLAEGQTAGRKLGTRHKAALGLSEQTDAYVIVVSEETGIISVARGGSLHRNLTEAKLRDELTNLGRRPKARR